MSRPLRIEYPGAWYHVLHRGAGRRKTFLSDEDRLTFFDLLQDIHDIWNVEIHAYSLMENHYHLLVHTPSCNLSRAMRHVDGLYTQCFNRAHRTDGSLFRGRFKSILIDKDSYLLELVRYIHLNPVKGGLCHTPSGHRWTSHVAYMQASKRPAWLRVDEVLSVFGRRHRQAINALDKFTKAGIPKEVNKLLDGKRLPSVLGSDGFKGWVEYNFIDPLRSDSEIPEASRNLRRNVSLKTIDKFVRNVYGVERIAGVKHNQPDANEARAMAIYLMRTVAGAKHRDIAAAMGRMSTEATAKSLQRFRRRVAHDQLLREKAETFVSQLLSNVQT
jgi:putative transposase